MRTGLPTLPSQRLDQLLAQYGRTVARSRQQYLLAFAGTAVLIGLAGRYGEVDVAHLLRHLSGLTRRRSIGFPASSATR